jgi:hypothetical protein
MGIQCSVPIVLGCCGLVAATPPTFRGLGRPPGANYEVRVGAVSDDGSYVVGHYLSYVLGHGGYFVATGVAWRSGGSVEGIPSTPQAMTPNGASLIGTTPPGPPTGDQWGWQWSPATHSYVIPPLPVIGSKNWRAVAVSTDARIVLGGGYPGGFLIADGQMLVELIAPSQYSSFVPTSMSGDASIVAGILGSSGGVGTPAWWTRDIFTLLGNSATLAQSALASRDGAIFTGTYMTPAGERAFRANRYGDFFPLGLASFSKTWATCISATGDVIGGYGWQPAEGRHRAILWTRAAGTRDLKAVLQQMGLSEVVPWRLTDVAAISGDGAWLVGNGINPAGLSEPWIARIPPFCYNNCDSSTAPPVVNITDFTCFMSRYAAGDPYANCDNSTALPLLNIADFTCFLQRFAAGCAE